MSRLCFSFGVMALAVTLSGCGIPAEESATLADPEDVPFELASPAAETTSTTAPAENTERKQVYLVQGGRLAEVTRRVPAPVTPDGLLAELLAGPTEVEAARGIGTTLLGEDVVVVRTVGISRGIATVDLGPAFDDIPAGNRTLALGQIVWTLTELPGVGRVAFTREGTPTAVPRGDNSVTTDSVSKEDYNVVAPLPA
ncbi:MAG: GerMN domain-containing protein [Acidimicrobiia bacterium]